MMELRPIVHDTVLIELCRIEIAVFHGLDGRGAVVLIELCRIEIRNGQGIWVFLKSFNRTL